MDIQQAVSHVIHTRPQQVFQVFEHLLRESSLEIILGDSIDSDSLGTCYDIIDHREVEEGSLFTNPGMSVNETKLVLLDACAKSALRADIVIPSCDWSCGLFQPFRAVRLACD